MQLHLFPTVSKFVELESDSPRKAFYRLMIEECQGTFTVVKESGCMGKVRDLRRWEMPSMHAAIKRFEKIINEKLNPKRGSPRKYKRRKPRKNEAFRMTSLHSHQSDSALAPCTHSRLKIV